MSLLLILIILLVLFGGGGFYAGGPRVGLSLGVALALHAWLVLAAPRMKAPRAAQAHAVSMAFEVTAPPRVESQAERSREVDVRAPRLVASMSKAVARSAQAASYGSTGPEAQQVPRSAS